MALPTYLGGVPRRHIFEPLRPDQSGFHAMIQFIEQNAFKAVIDSTYAFTDVHDAYDRMMSRQAIGKIVIEVNKFLE